EPWVLLSGLGAQKGSTFRPEKVRSKRVRRGDDTKASIRQSRYAILPEVIRYHANSGSSTRPAGIRLLPPCEAGGTMERSNRGRSAMKKLLWVLVGCLVVLAVIITVVVLNLDGIIRRTVETQTEKQLDLPAELADAKFSI